MGTRSDHVMAIRRNAMTMCRDYMALGQALPSKGEIKDFLGCSLEAAKHALRELIKFGLVDATETRINITVTRRNGDGGYVEYVQTIPSFIITRVSGDEEFEAAFKDTPYKQRSKAVVEAERLLHQRTICRLARIAAEQRKLLPRTYVIARGLDRPTSAVYKLIESMRDTGMLTLREVEHRTTRRFQVVAVAAP